MRATHLAAIVSELRSLIDVYCTWASWLRTRQRSLISSEILDDQDYL